MALPLDGPLEGTLMEYASRGLCFGVSDEAIGLQRVVSMEAERFPGLAKRFVEFGYQRAEQWLSRYHREQISPSLLSSPLRRKRISIQSLNIATIFVTTNCSEQGLGV